MRYRSGRIEKTLSGLDWAMQGNPPATKYTVSFANGSTFAWIFRTEDLTKGRGAELRSLLAREIRSRRREARLSSGGTQCQS